MFLKLVGIGGKDVDPIVKEAVNGDPTKYIEEARALGERLIEQEGFDCKPGLFELLDKIDELGIKKAVATTTERMTAKKHLKELVFMIDLIILFVVTKYQNENRIQKFILKF